MTISHFIDANFNIGRFELKLDGRIVLLTASDDVHAQRLVLNTLADCNVSFYGYTFADIRRAGSFGQEVGL